ncbi:helix-turn-helix transcriptional regulator [Bradyrhizobium lupini]|uniref:helix-turn-helix transcriptional regulator n=1 Tax=Rhizobium lupini TaxID=136996 RepID=UPI003670C86A
MRAPTKRLLEALEAIYDTAPNPLLWPSALGKIADCFNDAGAILQWRRDNATFGAIASESLKLALVDYGNGWSQQDFKAERCVSAGLYISGEPFSDRHIGPIDDAYLNHPFSTQFLRKHGLGWFGSIAVSPDPQTIVALSVQRSRAKPQFSDSELELIAMLGRHAEKSLRLSIRLLDAELANLGLGDALARIGLGVFALDRSARVLFANPVATNLLGEAFDMSNDRLSVRMSASKVLFETAIAQTLRAEARDLLAEPKPILIEPTVSGRRFVIYLLPITARALSTNDFLTQTRAIVLVIEQKSADPPDPAVVRDIFGLTLGEARVASLVGSGIPPRIAAERLGIAEDTARNVLKRVFEKLDVSRQSELTALLGRLVLR